MSQFDQAPGENKEKEYVTFRFGTKNGEFAGVLTEEEFFSNDKDEQVAKGDNWVQVEVNSEADKEKWISLMKELVELTRVASSSENKERDDKRKTEIRSELRTLEKKY
jgi:hypothetical protein